MNRARTLTLCSILALAACSGSPSGGSSATYRPSAGNAFTRFDVPIEQVLAESQQSGRPALLYFWASW